MPKNASKKEKALFENNIDCYQKVVAMCEILRKCVAHKNPEQILINAVNSLNCKCPHTL